MACAARSCSPSCDDALLPVTLPEAADSSVYSFVPTATFGACRYLGAP